MTIGPKKPLICASWCNNMECEYNAKHHKQYLYRSNAPSMAFLKGGSKCKGHIEEKDTSWLDQN